jgi:hypothetical protein
MAPSFRPWIKAGRNEREYGLQTFLWLTVARVMPILALPTRTRDYPALRLGGHLGSGILHPGAHWGLQYLVIRRRFGQPGSRRSGAPARFASRARIGMQDRAKPAFRTANVAFFDRDDGSARSLTALSDRCSIPERTCTMRAFYSSRFWKSTSVPERQQLNRARRTYSLWSWELPARHSGHGASGEVPRTDRGAEGVDTVFARRPLRTPLVGICSGM